MSPEAQDRRRSVLEKAKRHLDDGKWPELMLAMDALVLSAKGEDDSIKPVLVTAHRIRGHALARMSKFEDAVAEYQEAMDINKVVGDKVEEALCLEGLGSVSWQMGDTALATDFLNNAMDLSKEIGMPAVEANVLVSIANIHCTQGMLDDAIEDYHKAIDILSELPPSEPLARAYHGLSEALIKLSGLDEAIEVTNKELEVAEKVGNLTSKGFGKTALAICYAKKRDLDKAMHLIRSAIVDLGRAHDQAGLVEATMVLGMIQGLMNKYDLALEELRKAETMASRSGLESLKSEVLAHKARVLDKLGSGVAAKSAFCEAIDINKKLGNKAVVQELEKEREHLGTCK